MKNLSCIVCNTVMVQDIITWYYRCPTCGHESSTLSDNAKSGINSVEALNLLRKLRLKNFTKIITILLDYKKTDKTIGLDIGCGSGLFLDTTKQFGLIFDGVEPDKNTSLEASKKGYKIYNGIFPDILSGSGVKSSSYDFITFNDVLEHIPDTNIALEYAHKFLRTSNGGGEGYSQ